MNPFVIAFVMFHFILILQIRSFIVKLGNIIKTSLQKRELN